MGGIRGEEERKGRWKEEAPWEGGEATGEEEKMDGAAFG